MNSPFLCCISAKRLGQELADGGAFLEITTTSASIIKVRDSLLLVCANLHLC